MSIYPVAQYVHKLPSPPPSPPPSHVSVACQRPPDELSRLCSSHSSAIAREAGPGGAHTRPPLPSKIILTRAADGRRVDKPAQPVWRVLLAWSVNANRHGVHSSVPLVCSSSSSSSHHNHSHRGRSSSGIRSSSSSCSSSNSRNTSTHACTHARPFQERVEDG